MDLSGKLDFELAWDKTKSNLRDTSRIFVNNPYIVDILDRHSEDWLENFTKKVADGSYNPDESRIINIPKKGWNIRPGNALRIEDALMYSALVLDLYDDIQDEIKWSARKKRYSRILLDDKAEKGWIKYPSEVWKEWNTHSKKTIDNFEYIVFTDVASCFENIELRILRQELNNVSEKEEVKELLMDCLRRWSRTNDRGLPQGFYPSDILSELYLNRVDEKLKLRDFTHTRYSDNLRVFCDSKREAKEALKTLTEIYRKRGLNLQRHKTELVTADEAKKRLKEPDKRIEELHPKNDGEKRQPRIRRQRGGDPYSGSSDGFDPSSQNPYTDGGEKPGDVDTPGIEEEKLVDAFKEEFVKSGRNSFNKHLFRFLLGRLGKYGNDVAVDYCLSRIKEGKTEARQILDSYFIKLDEKERIADKLASFIKNEEITYKFQEFAIVRWFWEADVESDFVTEVVRMRLDEGQMIPETKNYAIAYMGEHGTQVDLEDIAILYGEERRDVTRAVILCSLKNMEKSRRNSLYRDAKGDNQYCDFATIYAKEIAE